MLEPVRAARTRGTCRGPLDVDAMQAAARLLEGRHDFAAFQAAGGTQRTTEREVFASRLVARDADDSGAPADRRRA